ncbi:hypothetical protein KKE26_08930 [bacterium]|nr:hypothetical protein [bacterium]
MQGIIQVVVADLCVCHDPIHNQHLWNADKGRTHRFALTPFCVGQEIVGADLCI